MEGAGWGVLQAEVIFVTVSRVRQLLSYVSARLGWVRGWRGGLSCGRGWLGCWCSWLSCGRGGLCSGGGRARHWRGGCVETSSGRCCVFVVAHSVHGVED